MDQPSNKNVHGLPNAPAPNGLKSEPTELINRDDIAPSTSTSAKDECYLLLAQVNLLRIRKEVAPAIVLCEEAQAKWPFRADVHALLGDLYQDLGRTDDAILRYCRVLELDPKSKANRQKLTEMVRLKRSQIGPTTDVMPRTKGLRLDRFTRAVILTMATLMLITITITPAVFEKRKETASLLSPQNTVDRRINLNPIILQPLEPTPTPAVGDQEASQATVVIRDPAEEALVELMSNDKSLLGQGIQVLNAEEDPVANGFIVTFLDRPATSDVPPRIEILRNSLIVAQSASDRLGSRDVRQFTIRCLLLSSTSAITSGSIGPISGTTSLAFVGSVQRSAVPASGSNSDTQTYDQLIANFTNVWWASNINEYL